MNQTFPHPEPIRPTTRVWPVFIPFAGCPGRCVFCAQDKQTGQDHARLGEILDTVIRELSEAGESGRGPYELAFFGGTFTALPDGFPEQFLESVARFRKSGLITRIRCSTRPDRVSVDGLARLKSLGLGMVELGIQSFDDAALVESGRGYAGAVARQACETVREVGLELGIQLMPGLPGDASGVFASDVEIAVSLTPDCVRLYPCVVMDGTPLAEAWRQGDYVPWSLEQAKSELAGAVLKFWQAGISVIRLGLAPEDEMNASLLAGPWHPAFGQSVRALALFNLIHSRVEIFGRIPRELLVPRSFSGEIFGHAKELVEKYEKIGLSKNKIRIVEQDLFALS